MPIYKKSGGRKLAYTSEKNTSNNVRSTTPVISVSQTLTVA
jgi:hypothetical protein